MFRNLVSLAVFLSVATACGSENPRRRPSASTPSSHAGYSEKNDHYQYDSPISLLTGIWKVETTMRYKRYLKIYGNHGFLCNTDGKSASAAVFVQGSADNFTLSSRSEFGPYVMSARVTATSGGNQQMFTSSKGFEEVWQLVETEQWPHLCTRLERGESPSFQEFMDTWDPEQPRPWGPQG